MPPGGGAVPVAQDPGGVGDDGHGVAPARELEGEIVVVPDRRGDPGDAGGVPGREPLHPKDPALGDGLHLAAVEAVGIDREPLEEEGLGLGPLGGGEALGEGFGEVVQG